MLPFRTGFLTLKSRRRCQKAGRKRRNGVATWRAMAEAGIRDYPRDEIIQHHAELQQLLLDMAARSAGGRRASGRYKAYDTARLLYIKTVAFPSLRLGKRIDTEDWRLLFLPITSRDDNGSASDKEKLDRWCKQHKKDPRSKSSESYGLDEKKQLTVLEWVARNSEGYVPPQPAQVGRPRTYRLDDRVSKDYAGCTLSELAHDGMRKKLKPNARVPGGQTLLWFDSLRYQWRFPEHVGLFLALQELANSGCRTQGNSGEVLITARHARAAYEQYARNDLEPRDDDAILLAVDDAIDPNVFEPVEPAFEKMDRISPAQRDFFERTVKEMETDPYDKWTSLWKRAPDATLLDNTKFDRTVADRYDLLDAFFWSPSRLNQWKKLGVEMPCARHGWKHKKKVTVKRRWASRLVKDITRDFILAGQECVCSECRKELAARSLRSRAVSLRCSGRLADLAACAAGCKSSVRRVCPSRERGCPRRPLAIARTLSTGTLTRRTFTLARPSAAAVAAARPAFQRIGRPPRSRGTPCVRVCTDSLRS